jgi:hypothetical protein
MPSNISENDRNERSDNPSHGTDDSSLFLGSLLERMCFPLRPRVMAYLVALLFTVLLSWMEIERVDVTENVIPSLAPDSRIAPYRSQIIADPDGTRWVMYTQKSWEERTLRLPHWNDGNAYNGGHTIGWSSPPMWWLKSLAYIRHVTTGQDMKCAIAEVAPYYNPFLWVAAAFTLGALAVLSFGWRGAFIIPGMYAVLFFGKFGIYVPDHHLWILLLEFAEYLCLSAPFLSEKHERDRAWFIGAALFSGLGFWISAPSQALVTIGLFVGFVFAPRDAARKVDSANWRYFGEITAALSVAFFLFEFYPDYQIRVELNNPVYAAGMLVAGIWFWQAHEFVNSGLNLRVLNVRWLAYSALFLTIVALPMAVYLPYCFSLADPYYARWEAQISEEQPIDLFNFVSIQNGFLFAALGAAVVSLAFYWKSLKSEWKVGVFLASGFVAVFGVFSIAHNRFSDMVICGSVAIICFALPSRKSDSWGWISAVLFALVGVTAVTRSRTLSTQTEIYGLQSSYIASIYNMRGVSESLLKVANGKKGGVLAPSDNSNQLNYFTEFPAYSPAIYDNSEGLRYTYTVFYYEQPSGHVGWGTIRAMLQLGGVQYIIIPKDFSYDTSYMIYGKNRIVDPRFCFAYYLIHTDKDKFVPWLTLEKDDEKFRIFSVHLNEAAGSAGHEKGNGK